MGIELIHQGEGGHPWGHDGIMVKLLINDWIIMVKSSAHMINQGERTMAHHAEKIGDIDIAKNMVCIRVSISMIYQCTNNNIYRIVPPRL